MVSSSHTHFFCVLLALPCFFLGIINALPHPNNNDMNLAGRPYLRNRIAKYLFKFIYLCTVTFLEIESKFTSSRNRAQKLVIILCLAGFSIKYIICDFLKVIFFTI